MGYDLKSKRINPTSVKQRDVCVYIQENLFCVIWKKKNRKDTLLNGVEEIEKNFENVKNKINENNLCQRIRYIYFPNMKQ